MPITEEKSLIHKGKEATIKKFHGIKRSISKNSRAIDSKKLEEGKAGRTNLLDIADRERTRGDEEIGLYDENGW